MRGMRIGVPRCRDRQGWLLRGLPSPNEAPFTGWPAPDRVSGHLAIRDMGVAARQARCSASAGVASAADGGVLSRFQDWPGTRQGIPAMAAFQKLEGSPEAGAARRAAGGMAALSGLPLAALAVMFGVVLMVNVRHYGWLAASGGFVLCAVGLALAVRCFLSARPASGPADPAGPVGHARTAGPVGHARTAGPVGHARTAGPVSPARTADPAGPVIARRSAPRRSRGGRELSEPVKSGDVSK